MHNSDDTQAPRIALVVAMDCHGLIGRCNQLPWHLPNDLAHFKRLTLHKPIIMGRKTFESIGRPLPERKNIVITRHPERHAVPGCHFVSSMAAALGQAASAEEVFIIGGAQLYQEGLSIAQRIYLTRIAHGFEDGDTWFPPLDDTWQEIVCEPQPADERNPYPHAFCILERSPCATS